MAKPTKEELKEQRKTEWQIKSEKQARDAKMKKYGTWAGVLIGFVIFVGLLVWLVSPSGTSNNDISIAAVTSSDISKGKEDSKVVVVEYGDFQCPSCKAYDEQVMKALVPNYQDRVKFVWRNFPLSMHQNAMIAAQAAYAAHLQDKFWEMSHLLFENQAEWSAFSESNAKDKFAEYAVSLSLDSDKFKSDMDSQETKDFITNQQNEGLKAGINSTPTFFVNGKRTEVTTYEEFQKLLDDSLVEAK